MAVSLIPMPALRAGPQGYNFRPAGQGLDSVRQQNNQNAMLDQRDASMTAQRDQFAQNQSMRQQQMAAQGQHRNAMLALQKSKFDQSQRISPVEAARLGLLKSQTALADKKLNGFGQKPQQANFGLDKDGRMVGGELIPAQFNGAGNLPNNPAAVTAGDVPGVITSKGKSDRLATKYNEGNRAMAAATPAQQRRLLKHMQVQQMWTRANGRPPKTGHVYSEDGRQVASGALSVGAQRQKSEREISKNAIKLIDNAVKTMTNSSLVNRSVASNLDGSAVGRIVNSALGNDKLAQAYKDYDQGVLSAVYALSGKTTTNAEMNRFLEAFSPKDGEGASRIKMKSNRIKGMLKAIQGGMSKGLSYEDAEASALSRDTPQTSEQPKKPDRAAIRERYKKFGAE
jgi:hypothetical protein